MATVKTVILDALNELLEAEFNKFKWCLLGSCNPPGVLENADRNQVVNFIEQHYGRSNAGKIAVAVLYSIRKKQLADQLNGKLQEVPEDNSAGGGASSRGTSVTPQTNGVTQNITTSGHGTVKAHVFQGGHFNGSLTFN